MNDGWGTGDAWPQSGKPYRAVQDLRQCSGQASIELVAGLPVLLLAALISLQLLVAGYSLTLADGAAEAGALALASGHPLQPAVRDALPAWAEHDVDIAVSGGEVTVRVRSPSPLPSIGDRLVVTSSAAARPR